MSTVTTTNTGRKIRGDSKLDQLSPAQREQLHHWLQEENGTYGAVVNLIRGYFGLTVGQSAVFAYYHRHIAPDRHHDDIAAAAAFASLEPGDFDAPTITKAKALAFTSLARPQPQVRTASRLLDLVHRVKKQELAEKRLALEERRVALRESLAAHPPCQSRSSTSAFRSPSPIRPPRPTPPPEQPHSLPPPPSLTPAPSAPTPSSSSAPVTSLPPPCPPCPNPLNPPSLTPLPPPPIPDSPFPSFPASVQSSPPLSLPSQKSSQIPPLYSGSFAIVRPSTPPPSPSPQTPPAASPPAPAPRPRIPYRDPTLSEWTQPA